MQSINMCSNIIKEKDGYEIYFGYYSFFINSGNLKIIYNKPKHMSNDVYNQILNFLYMLNNMEWGERLKYLDVLSSSKQCIDKFSL